MGLRFWRCWRRACGAVNAAAGTENFTSAGRFKNRQSQAAFFFASAQQVISVKLFTHIHARSEKTCSSTCTR